ncbi:PREDICTED: uncharacterized protein LOC18605449 [Theobroma cacao]|uniref:Uncharacterized protein LOC18605449 n=1 Tax=Theobroma cacao TaxID=3641 RepID=A0AB32W3D1_THECC|nr:PREDICTED: uncharacterized protein LOC18605449 [Theobroma cacao]
MRRSIEASTTLSFSFHVKFDANKDALAEQNRLYGSLPQCLASFSARLKSNFSSSSVPSASSFHLLLNSTLSWAGTPTSLPPSLPPSGSHIEIVKTLQCPCWSPMPLLLLQIWVKGKVYEIGSSGIKQSKRASC